MNRIRRWVFPLLAAAMLLLLLPAAAGADVTYQGKSYPEDAEYIDLGDTVVSKFDEFMAFLDQMPRLREVDMWETRMFAANCHQLAERYPQIRWGWTMVIKNRDHEHLVRTDYTAWSTLHNKYTLGHTSEDFSVLKYCWNLMALDIGHNKVESLDFLYDLPNLRVLIVAINKITDITPIASLKKLEYAELFNNQITDISPLKDLTHLIDLNLTFNQIEDLSPVKNLKGLQRLWLYSCRYKNTEPDAAVVAELQAALPDTLIDAEHHPTNGIWRYIGEERHPHYAVIQQMFGTDKYHEMHDYVPFAESWPEEDGRMPGTTPSPWEAAEALSPGEKQDFSDKGYLLPVDFSAGKAPDPAGYTDDGRYEDGTISVTTGTGKRKGVQYWYAEIQLTDASQIRTAAGGGSFENPQQRDALELAAETNAVLAINGDNWSGKDAGGYGYIVRQGILYRNNLSKAFSTETPLMDVLLIDEDGDFQVVRRPSEGTIPGTLNGKRVLNSFSCGPILVENGRVCTNYHEADALLNLYANYKRPRMCICQTGELRYLVLCCAGNLKGTEGMTLKDLGSLAASLGAKCAYNLEGGYAGMLYFNGKRINNYNYTALSPLTDVIYFASAAK